MGLKKGACGQIDQKTNDHFEMDETLRFLLPSEFERKEEGRYILSRIAGGARGGRSDFELPDEILSVIPTDPLEQLDLAKKITSMAIAYSVSNLEAQVVELRQKLHERDIEMHELEKKASRFERDFREADSRLKIVLHDNVRCLSSRIIQYVSFFSLFDF